MAARAVRPLQYYNKMKPEVGLISVGKGTYEHPRKNVVDRILLQSETDCPFEAPPVLALLQTEDGSVRGDLDRMSSSGWTIGNIKLVTDGVSTYTITGDNEVPADNSGVQSSDPYFRYFRTFNLDELPDPSRRNDGS